MSAVSAAQVQASRGRVDVWVMVLDPRASDAAGAALSDAERAFAARLRVGAATWAAGRVALRRVLARHLHLAPGQVALAAGTNGKPRLAHPAGMDLRFNLSHAGNLALVAVRLGHEVGVDLEEIRDGVDVEAVARDVFTARDRAAMAAMTASGPREAFFRAWARREALAKATGRGVATPPCERDAARFTTRELDDLPGFAAAVASEGEAWSLSRVRFGSSLPHAAGQLASNRCGLTIADARVTCTR